MILKTYYKKKTTTKKNVVDIFNNVNNDNMKIVFFEQLGDIYNGSCAQGRVTRIFQFYQIHINNKDSIYQICKK